MNTETGRIYDPVELGERLSARAMRREHDDHQAQFVQAMDDGKIVEVAPRVAQTMKLGQRELERRRRRAKAAKEARKRNR